MPEQRVSRHLFNYRWYSPLPEELWRAHTCCKCGGGDARWWKRADQPLFVDCLNVTWPTNPEDAPDLLCDSCYNSYCGGLTRHEHRRIYCESVHGIPLLNGKKFKCNNHIKRRLP